MKHFSGCADQMIGPNLYGYINQSAVWLGEKGGKYLLASARIFQTSSEPDGRLRIPVWSDKDDRIVIAFPPTVVLYITREALGETEHLVWVDRIDQNPALYQHDMHPMSPEFLEWQRETRKKAKSIPFSTAPFRFDGKKPVRRRIWIPEETI